MGDTPQDVALTICWFTVSVDSAVVHLASCNFLNCTAASRGGALRVSATTGNTTVTIANCTFVGMKRRHIHHFLETMHVHMHTHTRTHTRTHARTHTHAHTTQAIKHHKAESCLCLHPEPSSYKWRTLCSRRIK